MTVKKRHFCTSWNYENDGIKKTYDFFLFYQIEIMELMVGGKTQVMAEKKTDNFVLTTNLA
jgi:hypothetical protein